MTEAAILQSLKELFDEMREVRKSIAALHTPTDCPIGPRLRSLERRAWVATGAGSVIGFILGVVAPKFLGGLS